ncbi:MAG: hypothetical protein ACI9V1_002639 [Spirosomataceae bacterium]|jgi:hypothetical protein
MAISDESEKILFDFDFCGICKQLFHIEADKTTYKRKLQRFTDGCQNVKVLSEPELRLIPKAAAVFIFYLGVQTRRFD